MIVTSEEGVDMEKAKADTAKQASKFGMEVLQADPAVVAKARRKAKNLIPPKYASPATSGFHADVKADTNTFDFNLE